MVIPSSWQNSLAGAESPPPPHVFALEAPAPQLAGACAHGYTWWIYGDDVRSARAARACVPRARGAVFEVRFLNLIISLDQS